MVCDCKKSRHKLFYKYARFKFGNCEYGQGTSERRGEMRRMVKEPIGLQKRKIHSQGLWIFLKPDAVISTAP